MNHKHIALGSVLCFVQNYSVLLSILYAFIHQMLAFMGKIKNYFFQDMFIVIEHT